MEFKIFLSGLIILSVAAIIAYRKRDRKPIFRISITLEQYIKYIFYALSIIFILFELVVYIIITPSSEFSMYVSRINSPTQKVVEFETGKVFTGDKLLLDNLLNHSEENLFLDSVGKRISFFIQQNIELITSSYIFLLFGYLIVNKFLFNLDIF